MASEPSTSQAPSTGPAPGPARLKLTYLTPATPLWIVLTLCLVIGLVVGALAGNFWGARSAKAADNASQPDATAGAANPDTSQGGSGEKPAPDPNANPPAPSADASALSAAKQKISELDGQLTEANAKIEKLSNKADAATSEIQSLSNALKGFLESHGALSGGKTDSLAANLQNIDKSLPKQKDNMDTELHNVLKALKDLTNAKTSDPDGQDDQ